MTEINKNNDNKIDSLVYGEIEGNRPVVFSKYNNERYGKGMNTLDIPGAQPDTRSSHSKFKIKYKHPLKYSAEDIIGAHPDTLLRSIVTKRNTNPLEPKYKYLGDKALEFDEDSRKFRAKFDYSSLYDFYYNNSKIAIKQRNDEMKNNNKNIFVDKKENNKRENKNKKSYFNFGEDKKAYPNEKFNNSEYGKKQIVGEKFLNLIQKRENNSLNSSNNNNLYKPEMENDKLIEQRMKEDFPDIKDIPEFKEYNQSKDKNYVKPEVFYPYQHEDYIIPTNPNDKNGNKVTIKVLQDLQSNYENFKDEKKGKGNNSNSLENQLDNYINRFPGLK